MGLFDRFRKARPADAPASDEDATALDPQLDDDTEDAAEESNAPDADLDDDAHPKEAPRDRAENGPFDVDEHVPEAHRLDLGPLAVPVLDGMQIRLETEDGSDRILAVTLMHNKGAMQLQIFAAPRGEGIWKSVREEIAESVRGRRGKADELYTDLGNELVAQVPVRTKDGRTGVRVTRFAGVDGPRWFMRAVFSGAAVSDQETRNALVGLLRGAVVDRGTEARPPRELLQLTAPAVTRTAPGAPAQATAHGQAAPASAAQASADQKSATQSSGAPSAAAQSDDDIDPFERGPEIAEVR